MTEGTSSFGRPWPPTVGYPGKNGRFLAGLCRNAVKRNLDYINACKWMLSHVAIVLSQKIAVLFLRLELSGVVQ
jgi:hypothetical protein